MIIEIFFQTKVYISCQITQWINKDINPQKSAYRPFLGLKIVRRIFGSKVFYSKFTKSQNNDE